MGCYTLGKAICLCVLEANERGLALVCVCVCVCVCLCMCVCARVRVYTCGCESGEIRLEALGVRVNSIEGFLDSHLCDV